GAEGDVEADTRGARRAARDAGAAGRPGTRGDEPPDAPPPRETAQAPLAEAGERLERMSNPDVGLDVDATAVLEVHRDECARDDVVAVLGEHHPRPLLPLCARARDRHRARREGEEL